MSDSNRRTEPGMDGQDVHEDPEQAKRKRPPWLLPTIVVVVAFLGVWGVQRLRYAAAHASTNDAFVGGRLVPVMARVGGFVDGVSVAENQHVEAGQTLITLDQEELRQRLASAEAELAAARAAAGGAAEDRAGNARVAQARSQQEALSAQITAARADAKLAERDLERTRGLAAKEIVPRRQLDAAEVAAEAARARVTSLERQRAAAGAGVTTAEASVDEAQARVEVASSAVDAARLQLSYATVASPVAGTVARRSVEPGQLLQPGQPLLTVVADSGIFVSANFKETQLDELRAGEAVEVEVDAYPSCTARGEVQGIGGATGSQFALIPADNATGNFTKVVQRVPVRIRVVEGCGGERPLRPGMSVVVHVATG